MRATGLGTLCLLLAICGPAAAAPQEASTAGATTVSITGRAMQPGEVVLIDVRCACTAAPLATIGSAAVALSRAGDGHWQGLFGFDLNTAPGPVRLAIRDAHAAIHVVPKRFATRTLRVEPKYVEPPADVVSRILAEARLLESLFTSVTRRAWDSRFALPLTTPPSPNFGARSVFNGVARSPHAGVDFGSPAGTPVTAPAGGTVTLARDLYFTGNTVVVDHGDGLHSLFAHLTSFAVVEGASVVVGTPVGTVGATGRATGPHLHWSVRLNGARVDPLSLVAATSGTALTTLGSYSLDEMGSAEARR